MAVPETVHHCHEEPVWDRLDEVEVTALVSISKRAGRDTPCSELGCSEIIAHLIYATS